MAHNVWYAVIDPCGEVKGGGNVDLRSDWSLQDVADNFATSPGYQCHVWVGVNSSTLDLVGETVAGLERTYGPPAAVARG